MRIGHRFLDYLGGDATLLSLPELLYQFYEYLIQKGYVKETDSLIGATATKKFDEIFEANKTMNAGTGYDKDAIIKQIISYIDDL